ncbi:MAG: glycosyltransferase family 4 protein [Bacteriovorax sp.]|nr:glycosyltransferase family 4 protein [Bacteriovorax sp.]
MTKKNILVDFEKIKDPYSGLGQFCAHLKTFFDESALAIRYWTPGKFQKLAKKFPLILPKCDVFHAVHQDSPYMPWSFKTKYILTIHDLNALHEHTQFGTGDYYKKSLQHKIDRASVITFISKFTQSEVERNFKLEGKKLQVIYNGISLGKTAEKPNELPSGPFLFSVGTVLPKKNFHVLIDFLKLIPGYKIILAGTTFHPYAHEMQKRIESEGLADRFFLVGTIDEPQKLWYYQNASAFIFPSLLEGFGLPVAEAMSLGLPLFISDKTSLPEIGGNDAYYFKNFEANHMRDVFLAGMKEFTPQKSARLIERSKLFNWKLAADSYLKLYKSV